jgi:outer membrane protein assembly factor BamB
VNAPAARTIRVREGATRAARELAALVGVLLVVGIIGLAFAWPWLPREPTGGELLGTYAPTRDGDARLSVRYGPGGAQIGWESQSTRLIQGLRIANDVRQAEGIAIFSAVTGADGPRLGDIEITETRIVDLGLDGTSQTTYVYSYRDDAGEHLAGYTDPDADRDLVFNPLPVLLPASFSAGTSWESTGTIGSAPYRWAGRVLGQGPYDGPLGHFDDCIQTETVFEVGSGDTGTVNRTRDALCAGIGVVDTETRDGKTGEVRSRMVGVSSNGPLANGAVAPSPPDLLSDPPAASDPTTWKISRVGRARPTGDLSEGTVQPLWLPTNPPVVLVAGYAGDVQAFDASEAGSLIRWSFHPGGTIYGQPAFDPASGRIYFGATDKHLYALDARGLFLWSFETGDNVASRPLVVGDSVVFGSEDGTVYCLDGATGAKRWTAEIGSPVVSWPALVGGVVVIGADDQTVYGLDALTGERRWTYAAGGAVEAPLVADDDGTVYVASSDGTLAALPATACQDTCEATWEQEPGGSRGGESTGMLRTAPLVLDDRVLVVADDGTLVALSKDDGRRLWTVADRRYVGPPVVLDDSVIVATRGGGLDLLTTDGQHDGGWSTGGATSATDVAPVFRLGLSVGGGALWTVDDNAVVRRIGPPLTGSMPDLHLGWYDSSSTPPLLGGPLRWTPVAYANRALILDFKKHLFAVDPATGAGEMLATLPGDTTLIQVEPVVAGDTLLTIQEQTLQAFDLRNRRLLWQVPGVGQTIRPPVVSGDSVVWVNGNDQGSTVFGLDVATGAERWRATVPGPSRGNGPVVGNGLVYAGSTPTAFDLATGAQRWQVKLDGDPVGGFALATDGSLLYLGMAKADRAGGSMVALDPLTGAERWRADLGSGLPSLLERPEVAEGVLIVPIFGGDVVGLDAQTGNERWRFHSPSPRLGGLTVAAGRVWFMLQNARFYMLDVEHGRPVARFAEIEQNLSTQGLNQRPLVLGDHVVMPAGLALFGFDVPETGP